MKIKWKRINSHNPLKLTMYMMYNLFRSTEASIRQASQSSPVCPSTNLLRPVACCSPALGAPLSLRSCGAGWAALGVTLLGRPAAAAPPPRTVGTSGSGIGFFMTGLFLAALLMRSSSRLMSLSDNCGGKENVNKYNTTIPT